MTPDEDARTKSLQLFAAYVGMLSTIQSHTTGWASVAEALDAAAREARSHAVPQARK
jgi:hypothetical protein